MLHCTITAKPIKGHEHAGDAALEGLEWEERRGRVAEHKTRPAQTRAYAKRCHLAPLIISPFLSEGRNPNLACRILPGLLLCSYCLGYAWQFLGLASCSSSKVFRRVISHYPWNNSVTYFQQEDRDTEGHPVIFTAEYGFEAGVLLSSPPSVPH